MLHKSTQITWTEKRPKISIQETRYRRELISETIKIEESKIFWTHKKRHQSLENTIMERGTSGECRRGRPRRR